MPSRILITMDDLETSVRVNAAFEAARYTTSLVSSLDDAAGALRRERPEIVVLTGALREAPARHLAAVAREYEASTLALLEPTDPERAQRNGSLGVTETLVKPVPPEDVVATASRLIERRRLQERTGIIGESEAVQEVLVRIEQMAS